MNSEQITNFGEQTVRELNIYAAQDIMNRAATGPIVVLLGLGVSLFTTDLLDDSTALSLTFFVLIMISAAARVYMSRLLVRETGRLEQIQKYVICSILSTPLIWGGYTALNLYLYDTSTGTMVILLFTVGIAGGASISLFIWRRVTQAYLALIFIPPIIAAMANWSSVSASFIFGFLAYYLFSYVLIERAHAEYWRGLFNQKLLENQAKELRQAKELAEQANRAKSQFLSSMSHELRTPMNAVLGFSQLLQSDTVNPLTEDQIDSVNYIQQSGNHLLNLINDVLDLSRIETGNLDINIEIFDIKKLLQQVFNLNISEVERHGLTMTNATIDGPPLWVQADKQKTTQVLLNLISNAIKYNCAGGSIILQLSALDNGNVRICVVDSGEGVEEQQIPLLFQPFVRLGKENTSIQGTGIGLSISKELVEKMEGTIDAFLNPEQGMTFWVELAGVEAEYVV